VFLAIFNSNFDQMDNFVNYFRSVHHLRPNCGTLLAYVTVNVQSDLILSELQQHLFQSWTAFQQHIMVKLMNNVVQ